MQSSRSVLACRCRAQHMNCRRTTVLSMAGLAATPFCMCAGNRRGLFFILCTFFVHLSYTHGIVQVKVRPHPSLLLTRAR
jgi:hypothetical protein